MTTFPASSWVAAGIFLLAAAAVVFGGLVAALSRRVIRGVCGLAITCFGLSGLYYFLRSPFIALMEILIYVGAVCVTIIFAVMLTEPEEAKDEETPRSAVVWGGLSLLVCASICAAVAWLGLGIPWPTPTGESGDASVRAVGISLLTTYSMAFELISLVLLVAIVGALAVARTGRAK